ncbi:hypothetical protein A1O1_02570 [Capronia coronata CBS 617.96]|uniref:Uncharacterized protein n=1 Tax=Capronia coronata CBS 617.96 TaxID=1182541 RepID=W9YMM7_9EURO|nr:uncharacterized protein A1O1_02570 [Capronia coronata CBS 617.96]EXJ94177.1 hypothetical protein A1O1_02570 [Capronia coronata CBS 617.96]
MQKRAMSRVTSSGESEGEAEQGLFFASPSPPPLHLPRQTPQDSVLTMVEEANKTKALAPPVANFMTRNNGNKFAFLGLVRRQVELIKARSQDIRDGQVTVFDKALLQLSQDGRELDSPVVIRFFAEQFLGINMDPSGRSASAVEASRVLERAVQVGRGVKMEQTLMNRQNQGMYPSHHPLNWKLHKVQ